MPEKFYPRILVASNGSELHFKLVNNPVEYDAFCEKYVGANTQLKEIKTLAAIYRERMYILWHKYEHLIK
jgi:hypothetical protein